jgi:hypothetical protein
MRRVAEEEKFPWPPGLPSFKEKVGDIWEFQEELSREIMSYLAVGIGMSPQKFLELMDPLKLPANEFSHSIMGLYHYFQHSDLTETCYAHQVTEYTELRQKFYLYCIICKTHFDTCQTRTWA